MLIPTKEPVYQKFYLVLHPMTRTRTKGPFGPLEENSALRGSNEACIAIFVPVALPLILCPIDTDQLSPGLPHGVPVQSCPQHFNVQQSFVISKILTIIFTSWEANWLYYPLVGIFGN